MKSRDAFFKLAMMVALEGVPTPAKADLGAACSDRDTGRAIRACITAANAGSDAAQALLCLTTGGVFVRGDS